MPPACVSWEGMDGGGVVLLGGGVVLLAGVGGEGGEGDLVEGEGDAVEGAVGEEEGGGEEGRTRCNITLHLRALINNISCLEFSNCIVSSIALAMGNKREMI